jgi:hypothetical protein
MPAKQKSLMQRLPCRSCAWIPPTKDGDRIFRCIGQRTENRLEQFLFRGPRITRSRLIPGPVSQVREPSLA